MSPVLHPHPLDTVEDTDYARLPHCFTVSAVSGDDLNDLILVASGSVVMESSGSPPQPLTNGEWLNGSTLLKGQQHPPQTQVLVIQAHVQVLHTLIPCGLYAPAAPIVLTIQVSMRTVPPCTCTGTVR